MISLRSYSENGCANVGDGNGRPIDNVAAFSKIIIEKHMAQVLSVHFRRHACRVGIPSHEVERRLTNAHEVIMNDARPYQIIGAKHLERSCHLTRFEIALCLHDVLEKRELT